MEKISGGPDKIFLLTTLRKLLDKLMHKKVMDAEAEKAFEKMQQEETKKKREDEEKKRVKKDEVREYTQRQSQQDSAESADAARTILSNEILKRFDEVLKKPGTAPEASDYIFSNLRDTKNEASVNELKDLIQKNTGVAEIIKTLTTKGRELHGNAEELIKIGQRLNYETRNGGAGAIAPIIQAIQGRVAKLVENDLEFRKKTAEEQGHRGPEAPTWLAKLDPSEKQRLSNPGEWQTAISNMLSKKQAVSEKEGKWTEVDDNPVDPPKELVAQVDQIWRAVEQREKSGNPLTTDELQEVEKGILAAESAAMPRDVLPGTTAFTKAVGSAHGFTEQRLNALSETLKDRLRTETPTIKKGVVDPQEFLREMIRNPGHMGPLLQYSPEMQKLMVDTSEEGRHFRDQIFLTIHSAILTQRRESSHENFGLYERADFSTFVNLIRSRMSDRIRTETGKTFGQTTVEWYVGLSNSIRQSRDIDFWASQPGSDIEQFNRSLALFQNEYSELSMSIPAVEQAFRAYETTLRAIRDGNDGYIPPSLVEYDSANQTAYWDDMSELMLKKMIAMGVVHEAKRDKDGFRMVAPDGHTIQLGDTIDIAKLGKEDPQNLETAMYMTLAKGFGIASLRFLEIFANSKVPGSNQPELGMPGFHSGAYEGVARAGNFVNMMIEKWKYGNYRYFHMMNLILPNANLPSQRMDAGEAWKAFALYRNDPDEFKRKYGDEAKRAIDLTNFSKNSSAWGPPYTQWRHMDSTIGWTDKQRELLGGSTQIMFSKRFADEAVKNFKVVNVYRERFRDEMKRQKLPSSGAEFDKLWQTQGLKEYGTQIDIEWEHLQHNHHVEELIKNYQKAFTARVWVETAMRNPLGIAHNMKAGGSKLHDIIIEKILGIPARDLKYGSFPADAEGKGKAAAYASPTLEQRRHLAEVIDLEGDMAAVRERAILENRELEEKDFNEVIGDPTRRKHALEYWYMVRDAMMGFNHHGNRMTQEEWYKGIGMSLSHNGQDYEVDWKKIEHIDHTLEEINNIGANKRIKLGTVETELRLNEEWVNKNWEWMFGTDDTAFRQMDILNLGSRQWVRRGGDWQAHYAGGQRLGQYLTNDLKPHPNPEDLAKALLEIRQGYEGDMIEAGWEVASKIAYMTSKLYSWDWSRLGSSAQKDIWKTARNVSAWTANGRRQFWDTLEHMDVLPPISVHHGSTYPGVPEFTDIHTLRKLNHADNVDVWMEILLLGYALAIAITIYRALTAPSEEEEGGGGGGHH